MSESSRPPSPNKQDGNTGDSGKNGKVPVKKSKNNGVSRKIRGTGYPSEAQLERYRRRIRVELVRDKKDEFGLVFASELKALMELPNNTRKINLDSLAYYLHTGFSQGINLYLMATRN